MGLGSCVLYITSRGRAGPENQLNKVNLGLGSCVLYITSLGRGGPESQTQQGKHGAGYLCSVHYWSGQGWTRKSNSTR